MRERGDSLHSRMHWRMQRVFCVHVREVDEEEGEVVYFMKTWPRREGQWRNL